MAKLDKEIVTDNKRREWKKYARKSVCTFITFSCCILFFFILFRVDKIKAILSTLVNVLEPIIIGLMLAYLLMPIKKNIEDAMKDFLSKKTKDQQKIKKWSHRAGIFGAMVFLFLIIALLIAIIVPALITSIQGLVEAMPYYVNSFLNWIENLEISDNQATIYISGLITEAFVEIDQWFKKELIPEIQNYIFQITSGVYSVLKTIMNFVIGIIVAIYVMSIKEKLVGQSKMLIYAICSPKRGNKIITTVRKSNEIFGGFIIGKIIDSAIIGVLCYIGCSILKMPSTLLVTVIVGVTNIIPFFGPFIGAVPSVLLVLIQSPIHAVYLTIFIFVLQQLDGNIIGPKILGDTLGLSSFWIMFAILLGGGMFGFFGMLLGVPIFAVIYYIMEQFIEEKMKKKKLPVNSEQYVELVSIDEKSMELKYPEKNVEK